MTFLIEILIVAFRYFHEQRSHFITFSGHVTVHICMFNWKAFMAVEFKQTVLFINFYIFYVIMFKMNFSITGKNIFLGGMNHCWLIHLLLRAEARSAGSSCDVWVSSGSIPLWLSSSWLNPLPNGDGTSPHRGTVRSDEFAQERVGNGMMEKSEKTSVLI